MAKRLRFLRSSLAAFRIVTGVWILVVATAHLRHFRLDSTPPSWDDAWYLEYSFRFYHALAGGDFWGFLHEYANAFLIKAPLISVLPLPFYFLFGPSFHAALLVNWFAVPAAFLFVFLIGQELAGEAAGLASVWICSAMPLLYGLPHYFLVETSLAAVVAATLFFLIASPPPHRRIHAVALGLCLGIGLLLKSLYLLYVIGPLIYHWKAWFKIPHERKYLQRQAKIALAVGLGLASTWYAFNWMYALGFAVRAGFGDIAGHYGSHFLSLSALWSYWKEIVYSALGWPVFGLGLVVFVLSSFPRYLRHLRLGGGPGSDFRPREQLRGQLSRMMFSGRLRPAGMIMQLLILAVSIPFAALSLGVNKDVRYLAPALPALAAWIGIHVARLCGRSYYRWAVAALWIILPARLFFCQAYGACHARALAYNGPPSNRGAWGQERIVGRLHELSRSLPVTAVVAAEHPALNANNLSAWSALKNYPITFISLGYAQDSIEAALIRMKERGATYLLLAYGFVPGELPPFLNRVNQQILERLDAGKLPYRKIGEIPLSSSVYIAVFQKY